MEKKKSFEISKEKILEAYEQVKRNKGAAGVDSQSLDDFKKNLRDNLYKIWNRMSSGTYFPPPVKAVKIPKDNGKERLLGIPTVEDRIAQTVVKMYLEPLVEPDFHQDSYGYRPNKSAHQAIGIARERCWKYDWVIDLDIEGFFDNLDHQRLMRSVKRYTKEKWILLYIERWIKAPLQLEDGTLIPRDKGTPQGGVISPLLANIFLHMAFDKWMKEKYPHILFERYADDIIAHCVTEKQAKFIKRSIELRLIKWKLKAHPEKSKIVYCKDGRRRWPYPNEMFDFLGYTFRPRKAKSEEGRRFVSFIPAVSNKAKKSISQEMRRWKIPRRSGTTLQDIAREVNPIIQGWINYYSKFYKSALYSVFYYFNGILVRWAMRKYKRFQRKYGDAKSWFERIVESEPDMFVHWGFIDTKTYS